MLKSEWVTGPNQAKCLKMVLLHVDVPKPSNVTSHPVVVDNYKGSLYSQQAIEKKCRHSES
jgi:hypothetical protein